MPDWDWQFIVSIACVLWAVSVLTRGVIRFWKGQHGSSCGAGACGDCPVGESGPPRDIIPLQPLLANDSRSDQDAVS